MDITVEEGRVVIEAIATLVQAQNRVLAGRLATHKHFLARTRVKTT